MRTYTPVPFWLGLPLAELVVYERTTIAILAEAQEG
jgi:hypothetical protein